MKLLENKIKEIKELEEKIQFLEDEASDYLGYPAYKVYRTATDVLRQELEEKRKEYGLEVRGDKMKGLFERIEEYESFLKENKEKAIKECKERLPLGIKDLCSRYLTKKREYCICLEKLYELCPELGEKK